MYQMQYSEDSVYMYVGNNSLPVFIRIFVNTYGNENFKLGSAVLGPRFNLHVYHQPLNDSLFKI